MKIVPRFEPYPEKIAGMKESVRFPQVRVYGGGSGGGKVRGTLQFYNKLKEMEGDIVREFGGQVKFAIPKTSVLQTDIYFRFIEYNRLEELFSGNATDVEVINRFLESKFPPEYAGYLAKIVTDKDEGHLRPMAVRSSSMVEDGERFSFSGIFSTIFVPNQSSDVNVRVAQLEDAIKFVYAGMATREVRAYKAEMGVRGEDGMGIMIQNVVGRYWEPQSGMQLYYPEGAYALFSFNNYAREGINEKDGIVSVSFGMGPGVVDMESRTHVDVNLTKPYPLENFLGDVKQTLGSAPRKFYALDLDVGDARPNNENFMLKKLDIFDEGEPKLVRYHTQFYDRSSEYIGASDGSPMFTMPFLFKDTKFIDAMRFINRMLKEKFGMEVDSEGAFDRYYDQLILYPLQARVQVLQPNTRVAALPDVAPEQEVFRAENALGKGKYRVKRAVHIPIELFDFKVSRKMGEELERINQELIQLGEDGRYALFVPGRLGSLDESLGIHATFATIRHAHLLAEHIDPKKGWEASQGTHFFNSVMGSGKSLCTYNSSDDELAQRLAAHASNVERREFATIYSFDAPLEIQIDRGKNMLMFSP